MNRILVVLLLLCMIGGAHACCDGKRQEQRPMLLSVVPTQEMVPTVQMILNGKATKIQVPKAWQAVMRQLKSLGYRKVILGNWNGEPCYVVTKLKGNLANWWPGEIYIDQKSGRLEVVKVLLPARRE